MSTANAWRKRAPALAASFAPQRQRARARAEEAGHRRIDVPHLVEALLEEASVKRAVEACGADLEDVVAVVEGTADEQPKKRWFDFGAPSESRALVEVYERALVHAFSAEVERVSPVSLFARALKVQPTSLLTGRLDAFEIDALRLMRFDAHGRVDDPPLPDGRGPAYVVVHNDPYTTMEAVVEILETWLDLDRAGAEKTMRKVHERGRVALRFGSWDDARRRAREAREDARLRGFPLELTVEPA